MGKVVSRSCSNGSAFDVPVCVLVSVRVSVLVDNPVTSQRSISRALAILSNSLASHRVGSDLSFAKSELYQSNCVDH